MTEIFIDPDGFQGQVDSYASVAEGVKALKYAEESPSVVLRGIDRYIECVREFNAVIQLLGQLFDHDARAMREIKASWMHVDSEIATKTIGEVIWGALVGEEDEK